MDSTIEVILSNGDRAEAKSPEAAIVAARTLIDDATTHKGASRFLTAGFYVGGTLIRDKVRRAELPSLTALLGDYVLSAEAYLALCDRATAVGVPTSLDDPESPATVTALREAVEAAEAAVSQHDRLLRALRRERRSSGTSSSSETVPSGRGSTTTGSRPRVQRSPSGPPESLPSSTRISSTRTTPTTSRST